MCLDEGTIQAFLDGELDAQLMEATAEHLADCQTCAVALSVAEEESVMAFGALEREFDSLVPTHRLWEKINTSLEEEKRGRSFWQTIMTGVSGFGFNFTTITAFASLIIVGGIFAAAWMSNEPIPNVPSPNVKTEVALNNAKVPSLSDVVDLNAESDDSTAETNVPVVNRKTSSKEDFKVTKTNYIAPKRASKREAKTDIVTPNPVEQEVLPGEETYIKTIASLQKSVDGKKDLTLKPSARIAYEKDMAVLDDAIEKMKTEVKINPRNDGAKKVLFASYQNKIDLLNSVSEKNELMASLK